MSLLDTACARVAISQNAKPAAVEDAEVEINSLQAEKESLTRERDLGAAKEDRIAEIDAKLASAGETLAALEADWARERALVEEVLGLREKIAKGSAPPPPPAEAAPSAPVEAPPPLAAGPAPAPPRTPAQSRKRSRGQTARPCAAR